MNKKAYFDDFGTYAIVPIFYITDADMHVCVCVMVVYVHIKTLLFCLHVCMWP